MDLYEALKAGTSEAELIKAFQKDLKDARDKISAEAADAKELTKARDALAEAIIDYAKLAMGEIPGNYNKDSINTILKGLERGYPQALNNFIVSIKKTKDKPPKLLIEKDNLDPFKSNEFIRQFLRNL